MIKESIEYILSDYSILEIATRIMVAYIMGIFIGRERNIKNLSEVERQA